MPLTWKTTNWIVLKMPRQNKIFLAAVGGQEVAAVKERIEIAQADEGAVCREELRAARHGVIKIEQHGKEDKNAENNQVGQDEKIAHFIDADPPLDGREQAVDYRHQQQQQRAGDGV